MPPSRTSASPAWLVAPDSFKGTFSAAQVADALAEGLRAARCVIDVCPLADGGEGTLRVLVDALGGSIKSATARDPLGRKIDAKFGILTDSHTAIVGDGGGVGAGARRGTRARRGGRLLGRNGRSDRCRGARGRKAYPPCSRRQRVHRWGAIEAIHAGGGLRGARLEVMCDTRTRFEDAAVVFGAQKGADRSAVKRLTVRLCELIRSFPRDPRGMAMGGCAGGLSGGLWACFDAELLSGADAVLDAVGFDRRAARAGLVVTGEGCLDRQSVDGKLLSAVARHARAAGAITHAVVGQLRLSAGELDGLGIDPMAIEAGAREQLSEAGERLGRLLSSRPAALAVTGAAAR